MPFAMKNVFCAERFELMASKTIWHKSVRMVFVGSNGRNKFCEGA